MKIELVMPFFYPIIGGAEIYGYELSKRLTKKGYKVSVHTAMYDLSGRVYKKFEVLEGVKIYRYKPLLKKFYYYWFWMPQIKNTDLIHVCGYGHMCFSLTIQRYHKKFPIVTTPIGVSAVIEGPKSRWVRKQYDRFLGIHHLKLCKKIVVLAEEERAWCIERGISSTTIKKIPAGIPEIAFDVYSHYNFKNNFNIKKYILYVGRIHPQKGLLELVKAFQSICRKYQDIHLVMAGPDNGYFKVIEDFSKKLNFSDKLIWLSSVPEIQKYELISGCEFLVLPSKYELQGIVLVEAMAQGKPVIATNVGGIPDFVKDGVNGFLVPYGDVEALAQKMELLLLDKELYACMSSNARKTAEDFRWDKVIEEYEKVYNEVIK